MVCQMLFAQLSEKTSLEISHVLLFGHFSETLQKLPNYVLLRQGQPCQSERASICPHLQRQSTQDLMALRSSQLRQSDNVTQANEIYFSLDLITYQLYGLFGGFFYD